jgi:hypothetical protein
MQSALCRREGMFDSTWEPRCDHRKAEANVYGDEYTTNGKISHEPETRLG